MSVKSIADAFFQLFRASQTLVFFHIYVSGICSHRGGSRIFFRRGCTRLLLYFNTNKPLIFFFCRIPVVLENRRSPQGGGCAPLAPSPQIRPCPKGYFSRASTYREKVASPRFVASLPLHRELLESFFFFLQEGSDVTFQRFGCIKNSVLYNNVPQESLRQLTLWIGKIFRCTPQSYQMKAT